MAWRTKKSGDALAKHKKMFARKVSAGHAIRREAKAKALAARNAYRIAIGLPVITG